MNSATKVESCLHFGSLVLCVELIELRQTGSRRHFLSTTQYSGILYSSDIALYDFMFVLYCILLYDIPYYRLL